MELQDVTLWRAALPLSGAGEVYAPGGEAVRAELLGFVVVEGVLPWGFASRCALTSITTPDAHQDLEPVGVLAKYSL